MFDDFHRDTSDKVRMTELLVSPIFYVGHLSKTR